MTRIPRERAEEALTTLAVAFIFGAFFYTLMSLITIVRP